MKVIAYASINKFIDDNLEILLKEESINQLLIFSTLSKKDLLTNDNLIAGKVIDKNNEVSLIYFNNEPFNLLAYCPNETVNVDAIKSLAEYIFNKKIRISGINANKAICETFIRYYKRLTKANFNQHLAMDIMEISNLNDCTIPEGKFSQATLNYLPLLSKWYKNFLLEATHEVIDLDSATASMKDKIESKTIYIFENKFGHPVSMAAVARKLKNSSSINLVYTDKDFRGKKYGLAIVFNLTKLLLQKDNKFCSLFVDKSNPISNKIYKEIGFKILDNNYDYRIS